MSMRIVFAGTPQFSVPCLKALLDAGDVTVAGVVSRPDRRSGRGMRLTPSPVRRVALTAGIDVITPSTLRDNEKALAWLVSKRPDFLVVVAFGMLLPRSWLDAPRVAPLNVHASLLPRWRGAAPVERALLAGDTETGACIMHLEEELDSGGIYASRALPITGATTGPGLRESLSAMGAQLLLETLPRIAAGDLHPGPQNDAKATYAAKLSGADRIIDWSVPAALIDRQVRCFSPRPGARTSLHGQWLRIIRGLPLETKTAGRPGEVPGGDSLDVVCGDGSVYRVLEVQPEGKKVMDADAFLRGHPIAAGQCFDDIASRR